MPGASSSNRPKRTVEDYLSLTDMSSGPPQCVLAFMCVTMFAEHPRVAFQTHAVRILDVVAADYVAAPETLYLKI